MSSEPAEAPDAAPPVACANCSTVLYGPFCSQCGQERAPTVVPLRELVSEVFGEVFDLESKLVRTLRLLLTRPGALTSRYVKGQRVSLTPPGRLYVLTSVVFAAALVFGDEVVQVSMTNTSPDRTVWLRVWLWSVIFMMPVFAGLVRLGTGPGRFFTEHLIFAAHVHAFAYLFLSLVVGVAELTPSVVLVVPLVFAAPAVVQVYLTRALRRHYGLTKLRSVLAGLAVSGGYLVLLLATLVGIGAVLGGLSGS